MNFVKSLARDEKKRVESKAIEGRSETRTNALNSFVLNHSTLYLYFYNGCYCSIKLIFD